VEAISVAVENFSKEVLDILICVHIGHFLFPQWDLTV
jgi:hypothetical protein